MSFNDPVLWICGGILLFGAIFLIWAFGKLRGSNSGDGSRDILAEGIGTEATEIDLSLDETTLTIPTFNRPAARAAGTQTPPVPREIADRLENMTQRLTEMQTVLAKQSSSPTLATTPGASGQGFSPETVDKLLKIIGNVIQQVDILQRSMNVSKPETTAGSVPKPGTPLSTAGKLPVSPMGNLSAVKPSGSPGTGPGAKPPTGPAKL